MTVSTTPGISVQADSGSMYLNMDYGREHSIKACEPSRVSLLFFAVSGGAEANSELASLSNKVLAAKYQTILLDDRLIADHWGKTRREFKARSQDHKIDVEGRT